MCLELQGYFFVSSFFGSAAGLTAVAGGVVLSDFAASGLGAGAIDAGGGVGAGAVAGGVVAAGFAGSAAFSGLLSQAATNAATTSTIR